VHHQESFAKIGQTILKMSSFFSFQLAAVGHLGFSKVKFLVARRVGRANMHQHTKFHQNRSNGCGDIAFNVFFQNGGRPPSWIFSNFNF